MKRVLEIINLPGSAINFIGGQFKYLHDEGGYEMHLICSPGGNIESFCQENGVHYNPVELRRQLSLMKDIRAFIKICRYIRQNEIDIVIAHQPKARLLSMIACVLTGVRHRIIFSHGILYETMTGLKRWLIMQNERFVSCMANKVICVSQYVKDRRLMDKIDKPSKQIILGRGSCNGIDTINKFNPDIVDENVLKDLRQKYCLGQDDFVIGFCGRLVRDKGVVELLTAFDILVEHHPDISIKLLVVGKVEKRDGLPQETLDTLNNGKGIVFTDAVNYSEIQDYYMLMNVLVLPSHRDGLGLVAIEASAMEIPAIVSDYTGCRETIIPEETGLYIGKDPKSIVQAVEACLNGRYARQLGRHGRQFVCDNFEHTQVRMHVLNLLNSL